MPSPQKQKVLEKARKRQGRGRLYLLLGVALIAIVVVGVYAYSASQSHPDIVYAKLNTSMGVIEVELYWSKTPQTVSNFVSLAKSGFYNNLVWHRIVKGFVIQTGDPYTKNGLNNDTGTWGTGQGPTKLPLELDSSLHNYAGYLAMAHLPGDVNSGTSQFFINLVDNSASLDGQYTVFGKVITGMDIVNSIGNAPVCTACNPTDQPSPFIFLTSVTISNSP
jgi:cyclophilin family peptidyl-prolyl cis-trans isomerase